MPQEVVRVRYEVASDEAMRNVVRRGDYEASPQLAHSVHVELEGLEPGRPYWYRFTAGDAESPVGKAATLPAAGQQVDRLRFAFASCQHYESGYFNAYDDAAARDFDLILHLGDYIYEGPGGNGKNKIRTVPGGETHTLEEYRLRHAVYRSDRSLQAAHASCPWLVVWDDHEFDNNYADEHSEIQGTDPVAFMARRAAAYQAYYEHMPLRAAQKPQGPNLPLYRSIEVGDLATFYMLDTRQYRTPQPCQDGNKPPCDGVYAADATLLGARQESWLGEQMASSQSRWNVLGQQVMMARVDRDPETGIRWSMDQWAGYDVARRRLLQSMEDGKVSNPVVLTGDIHTNWVNDLGVDFDDADAPTVATEFVGTSISSGGEGLERRADADGVLRDNPFVKFYNGERGYVACEITRDAWVSDYRVCETVLKPEAKCISRAVFRVEAGRAGAEKIG